MFNPAIPKSELSRQRLKSAFAIDVDCRRLFPPLSSKTQIYTAIVSVNEVAVDASCFLPLDAYPRADQRRFH